MTVAGDGEAYLEGSLFEAMFVRALGRAEPELVARLKAVGFDIGSIEVRYPSSVFPRCLEEVRQLRYAADPVPVAHRKLGYLMGASFLQTLIGSVLGAGLKLMGPDRTLARLPTSWKAGGTAQKPTVEKLADKRWRIAFQDREPLPEFTAGCLMFPLEKTGIKPSIDVESRNANGFSLIITW